MDIGTLCFVRTVWHKQESADKRKMQSKHGIGEQKMANEKRLIEVESAWEKAQKIFSDSALLLAIRVALDKAPTVDAVEVVHGRWFAYDNDPMWQECSACGYRIQYSYSKDCNYCPNCGAKMDGDGNG